MPEEQREHPHPREPTGEPSRQWEIRHGVASGQPIYPVRALAHAP